MRTAKTLSWWHIVAVPLIGFDAIACGASTPLAITLAIAIPLAAWVIESLVSWGRDVAR